MSNFHQKTNVIFPVFWRKQRNRCSIIFLYILLTRKFYMATSKIVNSAMNYVIGIKSVLAQANKLLNQTLNIYIQSHLVEGSSKKMKY